MKNNARAHCRVPYFKILSWAVFLAYSALIIYMSHQSTPLDGQPLPANDKIVHFIEFFCYYIIGAHCNVPVQFAVLFAAGDELHQLFVPMREASIMDFFADFCGIMAACILVKRMGSLRCARTDK